MCVCVCVCVGGGRGRRRIRSGISTNSFVKHLWQDRKGAQYHKSARVGEVAFQERAKAVERYFLKKVTCLKESLQVHKWRARMQEKEEYIREGNSPTN